tara:strand:- start:244 stop:1269 length:1026 start_codon:yes stop_codon:yes gene_type:complete
MPSFKCHKILITLLFRDKKEIEDKINFKKINYGDLIKLASGHLMIPALYVNLRDNKLLKKVNKEFKDYLKYIYDLNKVRNNNLIEELKILSNLFTKNKINHVFLKGSSHIVNGRFNDIGERMIGDIDVLVDKSDYNKSIIISKKHGYKSKSKFNFDEKHYPRMIHSKKIFALEIHNRLLRKENELLNPLGLLNKKIKLESNIFVPSKNDSILHAVYNNQINDLGNLYSSINYRSIYDIVEYKSEINKLMKFKSSKYLKNFFLISNYMGITNTNIDLNILNRLYLLRFKAKIKYKIFNLLDNFLCGAIYNTKIRFNNFFRFFKSSNYRLFILNKINRKLYFY